MKKIKLIIFPNGKVQAEIQGVKGKKCFDYIKILEEILEAETIKTSPTSEYYENNILNIDDKIINK